MKENKNKIERNIDAKRMVRSFLVPSAFYKSWSERHILIGVQLPGAGGWRLRAEGRRGGGRVALSE